MKIIIGKFGEDGEVVWYDVESDNCKKSEESETEVVSHG